MLLEQSLPYEMQVKLNECAPAVMELPSGGKAKLSYVRDGIDPLDAGEENEDTAVAPILAAKLQEWFGETVTPSVGPTNNQKPVLLHLLTPAGRPAAITSDLPSFWAGPYAGVRADLRDKYKRHPWPDDPANAAPTRLSNGRLRSRRRRGQAGGGRWRRQEGRWRRSKSSKKRRVAKAAAGGQVPREEGAKELQEEVSSPSRHCVFVACKRPERSKARARKPAFRDKPLLALFAKPKCRRCCSQFRCLSSAHRVHTTACANVPAVALTHHRRTRTCREVSPSIALSS